MIKARPLVPWAILALVVLSYASSPALKSLFACPFTLAGARMPALMANTAISLGIFSLSVLYLLLLRIPGTGIWRWLGGRTGNPAGRFFGLACGLAGFSLALLGLGLSGLLHSFLPMATLATLVLVSRPGRRLAETKGWFRGLAWHDLAFGLLLLPAVPWLLASPLLPPSNVDTLAAHLGLPALWSLGHRITSMPGNPHFGYPMGFERLALPFLGLRLEGGVPAFHLVLLAVSAIAYSEALRKSGCRLSEAGGWLVFGCGYFLALAWEGHPDMGLVFAVALGALALADGSAIGLGVACAVACMCKYTGLSIAAAFLVSALFLKPGFAGNLRMILTAGTICLATTLGWMARNWCDTGNPVYPFAAGLFPSLHWNAWNTAVLWGCMKDASVDVGWTSPEDAVRGFPMVFWHGVKSVWFSPLVCLFYLLPLGFMRSMPRVVRVLSLQGLIFTAIWMFPIPKFGRYLMPELLMPLTVFLFILGEAAMLRKWVPALLVLAGGLSFIPAVRNCAMPPEKVLIGATDRESYGRAVIGGFRDAVKWIDANRPPRERVLIIGGSYGYGLDRPWLWTDDASIPAFLLATGEKTDRNRIRIGLRQKGIGLVLYNPVSALHRSQWSAGYALSEEWMAEYAGVWRSSMALVRSPEAFDSSGGWYVYGFRASADARLAASAPRPWVPGLDRLLYDENAFAGGRVDPEVLRLRQAVMGDFGVAHYQRSMELVFLRKDLRRGVEESREALRLGMKTPWLYDNLGVMLFSLGRFKEARECAMQALALAAVDGKATWLISESDRRLGKSR